MKRRSADTEHFGTREKSVSCTPMACGRWKFEFSESLTMQVLCGRFLSISLIVSAWTLLIFVAGCQQSAPPSTTDSTLASAEGSSPPGAEPPVSTSKPSEAPPEATIKAMLEKDMWGPPLQGGTVHTYNYRSFKIAAPREGNYLTDGIPANTNAQVYPVKVQVEVVRTFTDGTSRQEDKDQSYVFFQDEFGDWTYRFIQNN